MDSTKVEILNKSFDTFVKKMTETPVEKDSIWTILIPILFGAGLTFLTQFIVEKVKNHRDYKKRKHELIADAWGKTFMIGELLKVLAMYKTHKQYYYRSHQLTTDEKKSDDLYKKHYEKGQEQRATEAKVAERIAEFFEIVIEYSTIINKTEKFKLMFNPIYKYTHPTSSSFKEITASLDVALKTEESRIRTEYENYLKLFQDIQHLMT